MIPRSEGIGQRNERGAACAHVFLSFLRLGLTAFGGPATIAHIKELSVERKRWLDEGAFNDGIVLCQSIPGATAMQVAAYVGLTSQRITGALAAYIGFGLPAFVLMLALSIGYAEAHRLAWVVSLFSGLQVIIVALLANATYSFARPALNNYRLALLAVTVAVFFWKGISPFLVIIGGGLAGSCLLQQKSPLEMLSPRKMGNKTFGPAVTLSAMALGGLIILYLADQKLFQLVSLMLKIDLFAFGGGFASVPLMLHEIVEVKGWMSSRTFMDGIALGQITPGPIVITSTFVGYLLQGLLGATLATIAIFTPSFLTLILVAPVFARVKSFRYFWGITQGILASFVGLLFFATVKFALDVPWDMVKVLLGVASLAALVRRVDIVYVVLVGSVISLVMF